MSALDTILKWDRSLFIQVNNKLSNAFFDSVLPFMREEIVWVPFYLLLLVFVIFRFRLKGFLWFSWMGATVGLADIVSSHVIKKTVERARPCHAISDISELILRVECGSGYSFTSSHATNHMAIGAFIVFAGMPVLGKWRYILLPWALAIGLAQVYVGVHYPVDVICGFGLGALIAFVSSIVYRNMPFALNQARKRENLV